MMRKDVGPTLSDGARRRLWREAILAVRFGVVGVVATLVHVLAVWILISLMHVSVFPANLVAFLLAFCFSFAGNYLWTFGAPGQPTVAARRFFFISGSAFVTNNALLGALIAREYLPPDLAAVSAAAVIPLITYTASRLWGFGSLSRSA
jgi:putative flippase GtrA